MTFIIEPTFEKRNLYPRASEVPTCFKAMQKP